MKTTIGSYLKRALLLGGLGALFAAPTALAAGRWATLEAIHTLENPRNLTRPGPFGELGAYQFRPATWRMHTKVPFRQALDRAESDAVAVAHYDYLKRGLERNGRPATPYMIALAWNGGLDAAVKGNSPSVAHDYARRARNLAEELETRAVSAAASATTETTPPTTTKNAVPREMNAMPVEVIPTINPTVIPAPAPASVEVEPQVAVAEKWLDLAALLPPTETRLRFTF